VPLTGWREPTGCHRGHNGWPPAIDEVEEGLDVFGLARAGEDEPEAALLDLGQQLVRALEGPDIADELVELGGRLRALRAVVTNPAAFGPVDRGMLAPRGAGSR